MSDVLNTASFDQFTDFKTVDELVNSKSKIIFSAEAYEHFLRLINESKNLQHETGCFFLGKEQGKDSNQIFIDSFTTDFLASNGHFTGGAIKETEESKIIREKAVTEYGYDCLFHFHVHIPVGYYDVFSDQDLRVYKHNATEPTYQYYTNNEIRQILGLNISDEQCSQWRESFVHNRNGRDKFREKLPQNKKVSYFGLLATPDRIDGNSNHNNFQISALYCEPYLDGNGNMQSEFYRFPNMYYIGAENKIYRIGDFKRRKTPELTTGRKVHNNVMIQAVGKDPNTGRQIEDVEVGKYINGQFVFNKELSPTDISSLTNQTITREPGILSESVRKARTFISRMFNRENDRNI